MRQLKKILFIVLLISSTNTLFGQERVVNTPLEINKIYKVELLDKNTLIGSFLEKDENTIVIKTNSIPKVEIPIRMIKSISEVAAESFRKGVYWFPNPNPTRYLFAPSAFPLEKGGGYFQNTYLFLNSFNFGVSDILSVGGGLELLSTFGDANPMFFITSKVGFKVSEKFHAGSGFLYASLPSLGDGDRSSLGVLYGVGTYGSLDQNVTLGLGWGFVEGSFSNKPTITFSGVTRIARKAALVTENWLIPSNDYYTLFSYGIRFFGETIAVDLAFLNGSGFNIGLGIPYVDFVVKW